MTENPVKRYGFTLLTAAFLFQIVFAEGGVFDYFKTKQAIRSASGYIERTEQENIVLARELERLQKDDQYLEEMVRKKYGFVRDGEKVYRVEE